MSVISLEPSSQMVPVRISPQEKPTEVPCWRTSPIVERHLDCSQRWAFGCRTSEISIITWRFLVHTVTFPRGISFGRKCLLLRRPFNSSLQPTFSAPWSLTFCQRSKEGCWWISNWQVAYLLAKSCFICLPVNTTSTFQLTLKFKYKKWTDCLFSPKQ